MENCDASNFDAKTNLSEPTPDGPERADHSCPSFRRNIISCIFIVAATSFTMPCSQANDVSSDLDLSNIKTDTHDAWFISQINYLHSTIYWFHFSSVFFFIWSYVVICGVCGRLAYSVFALIFHSILFCCYRFFITTFLIQYESGKVEVSFRTVAPSARVLFEQSHLNRQMWRLECLATLAAAQVNASDVIMRFYLYFVCHHHQAILKETVRLHKIHFILLCIVFSHTVHLNPNTDWRKAFSQS